MKRFQQRPNKEMTWEFAFFNVFPVGPSTSRRPQVYDFDYNTHQEKLIQGAAAILAFCGDFGIRIATKTWKDQPEVLFHNNHMGEQVLCVKWNHVVKDLLAYGSNKGIVRILEMDENQEFKLTHTFTMDVGEPAQVLTLSWEASARYLLASLSSNKAGVIQRISRARWSVLDPIAISDTPSVRSILICSAELNSPFFVLAPSYSSTLELWSRIKEVLPTGEEKVKWQKISSRNTGVVTTTMCAFFFQNQNLIATAGANQTVDIWKILREERIQTPNHASLVHIVSHTLSGSRNSYIEKMTWIRGSLGVSCSNGFIYHLKVHRLPKKKAYNQEFLASGGTHGFIYLWNLYIVPYLLAFEERKRDWEINYYSTSDAPASEDDDTGNVKQDDNLTSDAPAEDDDTGNVKQDDNLTRIRQDIKHVLLPEYDNMHKSLSDAKDNWAAALNRLKDLLEDPNSTSSALQVVLGEMEQIRMDIETAAGKVKFAYEDK